MDAIKDIISENLKTLKRVISKYGIVIVVLIIAFYLYKSVKKRSEESYDDED